MAVTSHSVRQFDFYLFEDIDDLCRNTRLLDVKLLAAELGTNQMRRQPPAEVDACVHWERTTELFVRLRRQGSEPELSPNRPTCKPSELVH